MLLGSLMSIHKCVRPTRYFVDRLLEALRNEDTQKIKVTTEMPVFLFLPALKGTATYKHVVIEYRVIRNRHLLDAYRWCLE